jgi:hypothetical protein
LRCTKVQNSFSGSPKGLSKGVRRKAGEENGEGRRGTEKVRPKGRGEEEDRRGGWGRAGEEKSRVA